MAETKRRIHIYINGKEVENTLNGMRREMNKTRGQLNNLTEGTEEYDEKLKHLAEVEKQYYDKLEHRKKTLSELKGQQDKNTRSTEQQTFSLKSLGVAAIAAFSVQKVLEWGKAIVGNIQHLREQKNQLRQISDLQGKQLDQATAQAESLAMTYKKGFSEVATTANAVAKQLDKDISEVMDAMNTGFLAGADARDDFLNQLKEYAPFMAEANIELEEMVALIAQTEKQGIFNDKGIDAVKEGILRLREANTGTVEALQGIGVETDKLYSQLREGSLSYFDALKLVSEKMNGIQDQSPEMGKAIADIFGGAGEDAGVKFLTSLKDLDLELNNLVDTSDEYTQLKIKEQEVNEKLAASWTALTGIGSALNAVYLQLKSGIADFLGWVTDSVDETKEATKAFEEQREKVIDLETNLVPLLNRYDELKEKASNGEVEQAALRDVIGEIASIVPTAITEFDEYGRALDINSDKARNFIEVQKSMLEYRNKELLKENRKDLQEKEAKITALKAELDEKNEGGYISQSSGPMGMSLPQYEKKLTGTEITVKQNELAVLQKEKEGIEKSIELYSGDYLEKLAERDQQRKEAQEKERKAAKKLAEEEAEKQKREAAQKIAAANQAKKAAENQKEADKIQAYREKLLHESQTPIEQEKANYEERLKAAGIFHKAKEDYTTQELEIESILVAQHHATLGMIELKALEEQQKQKAAAYSKTKTQLQIEQNKELTSIDSLETAKALLQKKYSEQYSAEEINSLKSTQQAKKLLQEQHRKEQLQAEETYLKELQEMLAFVQDETSIDLHNSLLSEEQKEALVARLDEVKLKLSEIGLAKSMIANSGDSEEGLSEEKESLDVDILGFTADQWDKAFANMDTTQEKIAATEMVFASLMNAWGTYNEFVTASENKKLKRMEESHSKEKEQLQRMLDSKVISQDEYNKRTKALDEKLKAESAEMEYNQAKRQRSMSIAQIVSDTALGVMKVHAQYGFPAGTALAAVISALGAANTALVLSQPLPSKAGYKRGGFTKGIGIKDDAGDEVAGLVHAREYVVPEFVTEDPEVPAVLEWLEAKRTGKLRGFSEGGYTSDNSEYDTTNTLAPLVARNTEVMEQLSQKIDHLEAVIYWGDAETRTLTEAQQQHQEVRNRAKVN